MKLGQLNLACCCLLLALLTAQSAAGIAGVGGGVRVIAPPASTRIGDPPESSTEVFAFVEREDYVLPVDVHLDISVPGYYASLLDQTPATVPAGTTVNSYYLFLDPVGSSGTGSASGWVAFDEDVIGVILAVTRDDSWADAALGHPGTLYPADGNPFRGCELGADIVTLEQDRRTFTVNRYVTTFADHARVLTVPEPATLALLAFGGLALIRRKQRTQ